MKHSSSQIEAFTGVVRQGLKIAAASTLIAAAGPGAGVADSHVPNVQIGADNNSELNPFIQPQDPALSGDGRDQTLQFGDILVGTETDDVQIGRLGSNLR